VDVFCRDGRKRFDAATHHLYRFVRLGPSLSTAKGQAREVFLTGTGFRIKIEDRLLASQYGRAFIDYQSLVPALIVTVDAAVPVPITITSNVRVICV
jgi:hypothetical protein